MNREILFRVLIKLYPYYNFSHCFKFWQFSSGSGGWWYYIGNSNRMSSAIGKLSKPGKDTWNFILIKKGRVWGIIKMTVQLLIWENCLKFENPVPLKFQTQWLWSRKTLTMNDLLEFTGFLLYLIVSLIIFPLFLIVDVMIWSVQMSRRANNYIRKILNRKNDVKASGNKRKPVLAWQHLSGMMLKNWVKGRIWYAMSNEWSEMSGWITEVWNSLLIIDYSLLNAQ